MSRVELFLLIIILISLGILNCVFHVVNKKTVHIFEQREYQFDIVDDSTIAVYRDNGVTYLGTVRSVNTPLDTLLIRDNE